jgi:hypothetical protein
VSIKENIDMIKDELNAEEKMFENSVKAERFIGKYRNMIIGGVSAIVVLVVANALYNNYTNSQIDRSNELFVSIEANPSDTKAKSELQKINSDLYDVLELSQALKVSDVKTLESLKNSKAVAVSEFAKYQLSVMNKNQIAIDQYTLNQNAIYKDMALVQSAYLLMQSNRTDEAHQKLKMINMNSSLYQMAQVMMHYGVK